MVAVVEMTTQLPPQSSVSTKRKDKTGKISRRLDDLLLSPRRTIINFLVSIFLFILLSSSAISTTPTTIEVARSISEEEVAPGDELEVSLNISMSIDVMALLVTEKLPSGFNITTSNPTFSKYNSTSGEVAWLFYSDTGLSNMTITYTVEALTNISEGIYYIEGYWSVVNSNASIITGQTSSTKVQVEKLSSTLSLSVSQSSVKIGETITVIGSISPALPSGNITVAYKKPDGLIFKRETVTSSNGEFVDSYKVDAVGLWSVTASWMGDLRYKGAESPEVPFMVEPLIEPWLIYVLIAIAPITVLGIVMFLRKRRQL